LDTDETDSTEKHGFFFAFFREESGLFGRKWGKTHLTTEHTEITEFFIGFFSVNSPGTARQGRCVISVVKV